MKTNLIGWTVEEYKTWAQSHVDAARTTDLRNLIPDEVRLNYESGPPKIIGYASVFNSWYELWPGFRENVAPGAFAKTIQKDDVRALLNHDPNFVLGRNKAETLILQEDERGLKYEIIPPNTSYANDLLVSLKRKDITQSSFGFNIVEQSLKYDKENDLVSRTLTEVQLWDVSPVTYPASPQTEVSVRMTAGHSDGGGEVIALSGEITVAAQSDEELLKRFAALKEKNYGL